MTRMNMTVNEQRATAAVESSDELTLIISDPQLELSKQHDLMLCIIKSELRNGVMLLANSND